MYGVPATASSWLQLGHLMGAAGARGARLDLNSKKPVRRRSRPGLALIPKRRSSLE